MPKVTFVNEKQEIEVPAGANLRQEARKAGVQLYKGPFRLLNCHGLGLCGTCLVLVKKGGSIRKGASVASWLYGVAYRVAARARAGRARSPAVAEPADVPADDPWSDVLWRDLRAVLDEEVNRLAEKYRRIWA